MEKTYKFLKLLIGLLLFAVLMTGAWVLYGSLSAQMEPELLVTMPSAGEEEAPQEATAPPAPDFTVYDLEGNPFKLSDFQGKPVLLNFWASWCGPCKSEMPEFQTAFEAYGDQIHFLIVDMTDGYQETVEKASSYIADGGYTFPVYYDTAMEAAMAYSVTAIPATYFIDAQGGLVTHARGALDAARLQQGIDLLLP